MLIPNFPPVTKAHFINSGGFASVFRHPGDHSQFLKKLNTPLTGDLAKMLERLVDVQQWSRPSDRSTLLTRFSWPTQAFGTSGNIIGFSMPKAPDDAYFTLTTAGRTSQQLLQMKYLMDKNYFNRKAVTSLKPNINEQDRLEIAIDLYDCIHTVHRHGLVYSDYSGNNLVVRLGDTPSVFVLDADSITTPELRERFPIKSPTWDVADGLDPVQSDRALFALWCWRFLIEEYSSYPMQEDIKKFDNLQSTSLVSALIETYRSGDEDSFRFLSYELRNIRDEDRDSRAIARAFNSGFARFVIREAAETRSDSDRVTVALAERHLANEHQIESSNPLRQRILLSRQAHAASNFKLDLPPAISSYSAPRTMNELGQLITEARETEVATHFANGSLSNFENHPLLQRAIKHALVEAGLASISARVSTESADVQWKWPISPYVNYAQINITSPRKSISHEIERRSGRPTENRMLNLSGGGNVDFQIVVGVRSPSGKVVLAPASLKHSISIPAALVDSKSTSRRKQNFSAAPGDASFFDVEEQQRLEALAKAKRQQTRNRRVIVGIAAAILAPISTYAFLYFSKPKPDNSCRNISIEKIVRCQYGMSDEFSSAKYFYFPHSGNFKMTRASSSMKMTGG